jgi:hypothetical protein
MIRRFFAAALLAVCVLGCTQSDTVPVTGTLTFKRQPADKADVMFNPKTGRIATGVTDANGRFTLSTAKPNDGALPGEYIVTLGEYYPPDKPPKMPPPGQGLPSRFPTKYGDPNTSPLNAKVERGAKNDFQFEVP